MPSKYSRLAVEKSLADEFSLKVKRTGRKPSEVVAAVLSAVIDAIDHGVDPIDMIHICRIARSIGLGRSGYEAGVNAGVLLRAYYKPREFLEIMSRVGPQMLGAYRVAPDIFRITDPQVRETVKGLFTGIDCKCEEQQEFLKVVCD
jgi:hypothetical protein